MMVTFLHQTAADSHPVWNKQFFEMPNMSHVGGECMAYLVELRRHRQLFLLRFISFGRFASSGKSSSTNCQQYLKWVFKKKGILLKAKWFSLFILTMKLSNVDSDRNSNKNLGSAGSALKTSSCFAAAMRQDSSRCCLLDRRMFLWSLLSPLMCETDCRGWWSTPPCPHSLAVYLLPPPPYSSSSRSSF